MRAAGAWDADEALCEACAGVRWSELGAGDCAHCAAGYYLVLLIERVIFFHAHSHGERSATADVELLDSQLEPLKKQRREKADEDAARRAGAASGGGGGG